jgi:hypothetical protein
LPDAPPLLEAMPPVLLVPLPALLEPAPPVPVPPWFELPLLLKPPVPGAPPLEGGGVASPEHAHTSKLAAKEAPKPASALFCLAARTPLALPPEFIRLRSESFCYRKNGSFSLNRVALGALERCLRERSFLA